MASLSHCPALAGHTASAAAWRRISPIAAGCKRVEGSDSHRHDEGVQAVARPVRRVELSEQQGVSRRLAEVPHPELGGLEVRRVDHKLLRGREFNLVCNRGRVCVYIYVYTVGTESIQTPLNVHSLFHLLKSKQFFFFSLM